MNFTQFFTQTLSVFGVGSPASSVRRDGQGASGSPRRQSKTVGGLGGAGAPESSQHIMDILLPNHALFCVFSQTA